MKTPVKIGLGIAGLVGLSLLFFSFKPKDDRPDYIDESGGFSASNDQFDKLVDIANKSKSDLFENVSGAKLAQMRKAFTANLTAKEANALITLVGRSESTWKASDKINFVALLKKLQGTPVAPKPTITTNIPTHDTPELHAPTSSGASYNPETDSDYLAKMLLISKWYDHIVKVNKARFIPRIIPSKNKLAKQFLPWSLTDLTTWTNLVYKGAKDRDVKDQSIMDKLYKKYPKSFVGNNKIYSDFAGGNSTPVYLSNKTNWNF